MTALSIAIFFFALSKTHAVEQTATPPQPVYTCNSVPPPPNVPACEAAYSQAMTDWQNNKDVVDYLANSNNSPAIDTNGNISTTNCVAGTPQYTACMTARGALNSANSQMNSDAAMQTEKNKLQQQSGIQASESVRLQTLTDTSATGSLQQVQQYNVVAAGYYTSSAGMMAQFSNYHKNTSDISNISCATGSYSDCTSTAAGYAASAAYIDIKDQANTQASVQIANAQEACHRQNAISTVKTSCNPTDPSSPVFFPAYQTPPDLTWFDPFTGLCAPGAPALCTQMYTVINSTGSITQKLYPPGTRTCPGGGTGCVSQLEVLTTPQGVKYTFKNKVGKSYSYYAKDLKDEKSLIKAGLTSAQAKNLLKDVEGNRQLVEKTATTFSEKFTQLLSNVKSKLMPSSVIEAPADNDAQKRKPTAVQVLPPQSNPVIEVDRKPSMEGLSKKVNGDLIGVRGDDIFKMINRRYLDNSKQDKFFGQYQ